MLTTGQSALHWYPIVLKLAFLHQCPVLRAVNAREADICRLKGYRSGVLWICPKALAVLSMELILVLCP